MKKIFLGFVILWGTLFYLNGLRYSDQKDTYFYTLDFPDDTENWDVLDDSANYDIQFTNLSNTAYAEVLVLDGNNDTDIETVADTMVERLNLKNGSTDEIIFCNYEAISGEYYLYYNNGDYRLKFVIFRDDYFIYVLMGYSVKSKYDQLKDDLKSIIYSMRIYYDNNIVYSNEQALTKRNTKSIPVENTNLEKKQANGETYNLHVSFDKATEDFKFFKADLEKAKKELDQIGGYNGKSWNGWSYFKINTNDTPDYEFKFWASFYQEMFNKNIYRVNDIYNYFKKLADSQAYTAYELAVLVMKCVQVIPYERPKNIAPKGTGTEILDFFTPNQIADYGKGDCDTKSLFMVIILKRLGYDALIYYSSAYGHAMAGININASGTYKTYEGKKYYFIESTYPGWKIGDLPPQMKDTDKWKIVPIR